MMISLLFFLTVLPSAAAFLHRLSPRRLSRPHVVSAEEKEFFLFPKLGSFFDGKSSKKAESGRKLIEIGRKSRAEKRLDDTENKSLRKVLTLYEEGLLNDTEVAVYFEQVSFRTYITTTHKLL
jgi:hypothetical protein